MQLGSGAKFRKLLEIFLKDKESFNLITMEIFTYLVIPKVGRGKADWCVVQWPRLPYTVVLVLIATLI